MLMRNADYRAGADQKFKVPGETHSPERTYGPQRTYSPCEMLLGQIVLVLLFTIAVLLRSWNA